MITTIILDNIHLLMLKQQQQKNMFLLVMRALRIYSLSNCQIYSTAVLIAVTKLCVMVFIYSSFNCKFIPVDHLYPPCSPYFW